MISKEEYVLNHVKKIVNHYITASDELSPSLLNGLIDQWEFEYEMEKEYRPEVLITDKDISDAIKNARRSS